MSGFGVSVSPLVVVVVRKITRTVSEFLKENVAERSVGPLDVRHRHLVRWWAMPANRTHNARGVQQDCQSQTTEDWTTSAHKVHAAAGHLDKSPKKQYRYNSNNKISEEGEEGTRCDELPPAPPTFFAMPDDAMPKIRRDFSRRKFFFLAFVKFTLRRK